MVSALDQSRTFDEVIVIDDGSTDNTYEIMTGLPKSVMKIRTTNMGYASTRNLGLETATSEFIVFLDADDWLYWNYAHEVIMGFKRSAEIGVVCPQVEADGVTVAGGVWPAPANDDLGLLMQSNYVWAASGVRRQAAVDVGGFRQELEPAADWGFWVDLRRAGWRIHGIHRPLWHWRDRADGMHMTIDDGAIRAKMATLFPS